MSPVIRKSIKDEIEICFSTLQNDPKIKHGKYMIFNGKERNARVEFAIEPGMVITTKPITELPKEVESQILKNREERMTEKAVQRRKQSENEK